MQAQLAEEVTDTQACQIELDKTAEDFRNLHRERQGLILQFQKALEAMKQRDEAIQATAEKFAAGKAEIVKRGIAIAERTKQLEQELEVVKKDEIKITAAERFVARSHTEKKGQEEQMVELKDEVEVMRGTMAAAASRLVKARSELAGMKQGIEDNTRKIAQLQHEFEVTKHRLESEFQRTDDLEAQGKQLDELRKMQETKLRTRDKEISDLREHQFKLSQDLFKLRQRESTLVAEIAGAQSALKNINTTITKLDAESQKQQELVYAADFQIQLMERKVSRAQGERTEDEKKELMVRIELLQAQLEEQNVTHRMLLQQRKRVADDVREKKRQLAQVSHVKAGLTQTIADLELACDTTTLAHRNLMKKRDEMMVAHDVLQLDITKLRDTLNQKADEVFGLENRKTQLQLSMQEREHEVGVHRDVLLASLKVVDEERHRAHLQLADRSMKRDKIRKRYELLMARFAPSQDPDANAGGSEAYYLIRAAQEKQELERQGDELDAQIRKAEKEVRALENTLAMLNNRNSKYRQSFHKVEKGDADAALKEQLQDQVRAVTDRLKFKKAEIRELIAEVGTMQRSTTVLREDRAKLVRRVQDLEMQCAQVRKEAEEYGQKLREAHLEMEHLSLKHRQSEGVPLDQDTAEERDFRLQETRLTTAHLLEGLAAIASHPRNADVAVFLEKILEQYGLELPDHAALHNNATIGGPGGAGGAGGGGGGGATSRSDHFGLRSGGGRRSLTPSAAAASASKQLAAKVL